ncbi:hypothetical protein JCM6882_003847 [Rhodosporidiobolus microsporus]
MSFFIPLPGSPAPSFTGSTLLLPQPSLSSLAQLSCDLLLHNAQQGWDLVGYVALADFVPAVGGRDSLPGASSPSGIAFGVEVYRLKTASTDLTLVLPRSPVIRARRLHFLSSLNDWVGESGFESVLLVAGVDAALRGDEGLNSDTPLRHFLLQSPTSSPSSPSPLASCLSTIAPPYAVSSGSSVPSPIQKLPLFPHGGLTRKLLETFQQSYSTSSSAAGDKAPEVAALTIYTFEGDVASSAFLLADALAHVVQLPSVEEKVEGLSLASEGEGGAVKGREWKTPRSWERGLMGVELGTEVGREMYG